MKYIIFTLILTLNSMVAFGGVPSKNELLMQAVWINNFPEVKKLIKMGASVNSDEEFDWNPSSYSTPASLAVFRAHKEILLFLLEKGANPNLPIYSPPIFICTQYGIPSYAQILIEYGADPNHEFQGEGIVLATPLMSASANGHSGVVEVLLNAGADPSIKNSRGKTAQDMAVRYNGKPYLVDAVFEEFKKNKPK